MADLIIMRSLPLVNENGTRDSLIVPIAVVGSEPSFDPAYLNLMFFENGRVRRFVKAGESFMAVFEERASSDGGRDNFRGYYSEKLFWENGSPSITSNTNTASFSSLGVPFNVVLDPDFSAMSDSDEVMFPEVFLSGSPSGGNDNNFKIIVRHKRIPYAVLRPIVDEVIHIDSPLIEQYAAQETVIPLQSIVSRYGTFILRKGLLRPDGQVTSFSENEEKVLFDIMRVFEFVESESALKDEMQSRGIYKIFETHLNIPDRFNSVAFGEVDERYHTVYTEKYFALLRLNLIEFMYWVLQYQTVNYTTINSFDLYYRIINIFSADELAYLPYEDKIRYLKELFVIGASGAVIADLSIEQQETIIKLIRSIYFENNGIPNYAEINAFFAFLAQYVVQNPGPSAERRMSYYEIFYDKIKDPLLFGDDGAGRKGQFVHAVYALWLQSQYNPSHEDPLIADNALSYFTYTSFPEYEKDKYPNESGKVAAPSILNYHSDQKLLWYVDDYKFKFEDLKVVATEKFWGDNDFGERDQDLVVGRYEFYQPVVIAATNHLDTIITLPVKAISSTDPSNQQYRDNAIPIFYLKYVDDLGDYSDFKQTIRIAIDIASFYYGIVSTLRYVRAFSLLRNAEGAFLVRDAGLLYLRLGLVTSTAETLSSAISIVHQILTSDCEVYYRPDHTVPGEGDAEYEAYSWCILANKWLFALEMVSMVVNALSRNALKLATRKMLDGMTSENLSKFTPAERNCLIEIGDLGSEITQFMNRLNGYPALQNRLSQLSDFSKYEFIADFRFADLTVFQKFEDDVDLIRAWFGVKYLKASRKEIDFLQNLKRFATLSNNGNNEVKHLWELISGGIGGHRPIYVVDDLNHDRYFMNVPLGDLQTNIPDNKRTIVTDVNGHKFYENVWFRNSNSKEFNLNGFQVKRKPRQFTLNAAWDKDRLIEEMTFAYSYDGKIIKVINSATSINHNGVKYPIIRTEYLSIFSDGTMVDIYHQSKGIEPSSKELLNDYIALLAIKKF